MIGVRGHVHVGARSRARPDQPAARLTVEPTTPGDHHVHLWTWDPEHEHHGVLLDAETTERLGIDLQIRASYLRSTRPPSDAEPHHAAAEPSDVPLIPDGDPA